MSRSTRIRRTWHATVIGAALPEAPFKALNKSRLLFDMLETFRRLPYQAAISEDPKQPVGTDMYHFFYESLGKPSNAMRTICVKRTDSRKAWWCGDACFFFSLLQGDLKRMNCMQASRNHLSHGPLWVSRVSIAVLL